MSSIRSILEEFAKYCSVQGCPFGTMPNDKDKLDQALKEISELIDGAKPEIRYITYIAASSVLSPQLEDCRYNTGCNEYQSNLKELLK